MPSDSFPREVCHGTEGQRIRGGGGRIKVEARGKKANDPAWLKRRERRDEQSLEGEPPKPLREWGSQRSWCTGALLTC